MVSTVTTILPILISLLKQSRYVISEINQKCREEDLPPAFEVDGIRIQGNANHRFEGFGVNLVPLALTFWIHYKPESSEHKSLGKFSIPITVSDISTALTTGNINALKVPLDSIQFLSNEELDDSPDSQISYLDDHQVTLRKGAIDEVGAARYDTSANTPDHYVAALQKDLTTLGFSPGEIDGDFGSLTESALQAFQQAALTKRRYQNGRVITISVSYQGSISGVCDQPTRQEIKHWLEQNYQASRYLSNPVPGTTYANNGGYRGDTGLDINVPCGTSCVAAADGEVIYAEEGHTTWREDAAPEQSGYQTPCSVLIKLDHPLQYKGTTYYYIWYTHLSELEPSIRKPDGAPGTLRVKTGQPVGKTGVANASPHLHFGVLVERAQNSCMPYTDIAELIWGNTSPDPIELPDSDTENEVRTIHHRGPGGAWERTITLPCAGRFVEESHYSTTQDRFPGERLFPNTQTENISSHLERSYQLYLAFDQNTSFEALYCNSWNKVWTPAEGGACGQGSVGSKRPDPEVELWLMTMMWAPGEKPAPGTKFLLSANNRQVVVVAGYETGPGSQEYLGGITREVHAWLRTNNNSQIEVRYLTDQSMKVGPVKLAPDSVGHYRVTADSLNVRSEPVINAAIVGALDQGQVVPRGVKQAEGDRVWMQINLPNLTGWASMKYLEPSSPEANEPQWLTIARREMEAGVKEFPGDRDNPRIVEYLKSTTLDQGLASEDETAWCSAFVNWCMEQANRQGTNSAWARSWLNWGKSLRDPKLGCIAVFSRGEQSGHVGFYIAQTPTHIRVLGGNQGDAVNITEIEKTRLLGYRWVNE
ncbi:MAG: TIGR02594 family protein [Oculatellaceae cyanobacterium bins.114]|nr:TIGR02594 family protein [Oculatellaceae cyanobacterium bins.114]